MIALVAGSALGASGCTVEATWTQQSVESSVPARPDVIALSDVACPAPGACVAVGVQESLTRDAFVLRQDGASWTRLPLPFPLARLGNVSCRGVDDCQVAADPLDLHVGADGVTALPAGPATSIGPLACVTTACLRTSDSTDDLSSWWDGSSWSSPATLPSGLLGDGRVLACSSESSCVIVGNTPGAEALPLPGPVNSSVWNGSTWSAPVSLDHETRVHDIACAAPTDCFASAGVREDSWTVLFPDMHVDAELLRWDGTAWSTVTLDFPGAAPTEPPSVTCTAPTSCTALWVAGKSDPVSPSYLGRWDGTDWTVASTGAAATATSVACDSPDSCVAVGGPIAQQLTGTTWTDTTGIPAGTSPSVYVDMLSCATASRCIASGDPDDQIGGPQTTWRLHGPTWIAEPAGDDDIDALSCGSASSCVAASGAADSFTSRHWDGTEWHDLPPVLDPTVDVVDAISCPTGDWCLLMADAFSAPASAWVWTGGTSWTKVAALVPRVGGSTGAVSCSAPGSCVVLTRSDPPALYRLEGLAFAELPTAGLDTGSHGNIDDIDCTADGDCVAVGFQRVGVNADLVGLLAVRRNGTWTSTLRPHAPRFLAVDCTSSDECVAVGPSGAERFDGTAWRRVASPPGLSRLEDVSCGAPRTCEVLGEFVDGPDRAVMSKLHIDG